MYITIRFITIRFNKPYRKHRLHYTV